MGLWRLGKMLPCVGLPAADAEVRHVVVGMHDLKSKAQLQPVQVLPVAAASVLACVEASRQETQSQAAGSKASQQKASARSSDAARLGKLLQTSVSCSLLSGPITGMVLGTAVTGEIFSDYKTVCAFCIRLWHLVWCIAAFLLLRADGLHHELRGACVAGGDLRVCMRVQSIMTASTAAAAQQSPGWSSNAHALVNMGFEQMVLSVATVKADGSLLNLRLNGEHLQLVSLQGTNAALSLPKHQQSLAAAEQPEQQAEQDPQQATAGTLGGTSLNPQPGTGPLKAKDVHIAVSVAQLHVWAGDAPLALAAALAQDTALSGLRPLRARPETTKRVCAAGCMGLAWTTHAC